MYTPFRPPVHKTVDLNNLRYRVHCWGDDSGMPVILLHGWADTGMSFQFLADAMDKNWYLLAPDWRGFGDSEWSPGGYWFPDYLADLDQLIDWCSPGAPVRLLGHSMGGNVAWLYAGVRPERVSHAVSLDFYGLADNSPSLAPGRYRQWLEQIRDPLAFSVYSNPSVVADRILSLAQDLDYDQALYLAGFRLKQDADGKYHLKHDPRHKRVNPVLYRREEVKACWRNITAKTLLVMAGASKLYMSAIDNDYLTDIRDSIKNYSETLIADSGHMLHQEQPQKLAIILEEFLADPGK